MSPVCRCCLTVEFCRKDNVEPSHLESQAESTGTREKVNRKWAGASVRIVGNVGKVARLRMWSQMHLRAFAERDAVLGHLLLPSPRGNSPKYCSANYQRFKGLHKVVTMDCV